MSDEKIRYINISFITYLLLIACKEWTQEFNMTRRGNEAAILVGRGVSASTREKEEPEGAEKVHYLCL